MDNQLYMYNFFSFWVYIWFVLYLLNIIKISPIIIFLLLIILLKDVITFFINYKDINYKIVIRIYCFTVMHHLPLIYLLYKLRYKTKNELNKIFKSSSILLLILLLVYIVYLNINNMTFMEFYNSSFLQIKTLNSKGYIKHVFNNKYICLLWFIFTLFISYLIIYKMQQNKVVQTNTKKNKK